MKKSFIGRRTRNANKNRLSLTNETVEETEIRG